MSDLWWPKFIRKPRLTLRTPQFRGIRMPSKWIFFIITLSIYYFIVSGSLYSLVKIPQSLGQDPSTGQVLAVYPRLHEQFLIEGIVGGALYLLGFAGLFLIYHSTRHIYRPRYAQMMLAIGWFLTIVSVLSCQYLVTWKILGGNFD